MTLTIEIPDEVAARVRVAAEARGQDMGTFAVAALLETAEADASEYSEEQALAAIEEGTADLEAGRYVLLGDLRARIDAEDAAAASMAVAKIGA